MNLVEFVRKNLGGRLEAFVKKMWAALGDDQEGEANFEAVLQDKKRICIHDVSLRSPDAAALLQESWKAVKTADVIAQLLDGEAVLVVQSVLREFFDQEGWLVPLRRIKVKWCKANKAYYLAKLAALDYAAILERLKKFFPKGTEFPSVEEFRKKAEALVAEVKGDPQTANALNGFWVPLPLPHIPQLGEKKPEYGKVLEEVFIAALKAAYKEAFPGRIFTNYRKGELAGKVMIVAGTRHDQLVAAMAKGPQVALFFVPMQGWSILADREVMASLPPGWVLGGVIDMVTAVAAFTEVFARDGHTPYLDMGAVQWQDPDHSLGCNANGDGLDFDCGTGLSEACDGYTGALLFLGKGFGN